MMMSLADPSPAAFCIWPLLVTKVALSTSMAVEPDPDTQVVMWPPPPGVPMTMISPSCTRDCQLPDCPAGPLNATIHSPFACPGRPIAVLCTGSDAPASAEIVLANTQQPSRFHA